MALPRSGRAAARWVLTMSGPPVADAAVEWRDGRVVAVVPRRPDEAYAADVITPGLVNAHAHLEYGAPFADLADGALPFADWLVALPARARTMTDEDWRASARDGVRRLLATGTTSVADVVTFGPAAAVAAEAGLGGVSYLEVVGEDGASWARSGRADLLAALETAPPGRAVGISPHTLYTVGTSVLCDAVALARDRGLRLHTHLAETVEESEYVLAGTGRWQDLGRRYGLEFELLGRGSGVTPARHLADLGGLGPDVHVAHGVHVDSGDRALLRRSGTAVAVCVRSNRVLRAGEPPVAAYLADGVPLAVGTDSLASCPDLDLLAELRAVFELALRQGAEPQGLAERLLQAGTRGGALAMGLADVGVLAGGARADLALFDVDPADGAALAAMGAGPPRDPYEALLSSGMCVGTVLDGASAFCTELPRDPSSNG